MGQSEQHDIMKLTRRIESLEAKVYGGNKKVAVYAPEPWMKEKVANVWGVKPVAKGNKSEIPDSYPYVFIDENYIDAHDRKDHAEKDGFEILSFQDFCKQHGISDKPDYVWIKTKKGWKITGDVKYGLNNGELWVDTPLNEYGVTFHFKPATQKEYLEQESKKKTGKPDYVKYYQQQTKEKVVKKVMYWDNESPLVRTKYGVNVLHIWYHATEDEYDEYWKKSKEKEYLEQESEKEPELKLNEEWNNKYHNGVAQGAYLEGAKDMQKAIYDRALWYFKEGGGYTTWDRACKWAIADMINGDLKPPKQ